MAVMAASAAITALQAGSQIAQGLSQRSAGKFQAEQVMRAAQYGRIQALQTDQAMRKQLEVTMGNIDAVRAAAGQDTMSPTGQAVTSYVTSNADRERESKVRSILMQVSEQERAKRFYQQSAGRAMFGSLLSAAGTVAKGISGAMGSMGGGGGGEAAAAGGSDPASYGIY